MPDFLPLYQRIHKNQDYALDLFGVRVRAVLRNCPEIRAAVNPKPMVRRGWFTTRVHQDRISFPALQLMVYEAVERKELLARAWHQVSARINEVQNIMRDCERYCQSAPYEQFAAARLMFEGHPFYVTGLSEFDLGAVAPFDIELQPYWGPIE